MDTYILCEDLQGSVIEPLLFLLYVNDIYSSSNKLNFYLFADDTNILYSHKNLKSLEHVMNCELNNVLTIGLLSKLRHFVPHHTLVNINSSLVTPYLRYGVIAWGQARKTHLNKLLILQKRALR